MLFSTALLSVAEFSCAASDPVWHERNEIGDRAVVAFPRVPVGIRLATGERILATPNLAMLYNPRQEYDRHLRSELGDACLYVQLHQPALEALELEGSAVRDGRLCVSHAPAGKQTYLRQHLLARYFDGPRPDILLAEETAIGLVQSVVPRAAPSVAPARRGTESGHRVLAEDAKELLGSTVRQNLSLQRLASRLGSSPFHLARVFRRETGYSLHDYRTQLRLRLALELLPANGSLTELAIELGFASHSHFTDTFRRVFGVAPSVVRDGTRIQTLLSAA